VAWGDEEYGARSDAIYVEQTNLDEIVCAINVDGVGQYTGTNTITMLADSSPFREAVTAITKAYAGVEWVGPWYASNHSTYAMRGVPSIALSSTGVNLIHLPMDTLDWINPAKLLEVIHVGEGIIQHIHHQPVAWSRPPQEEDKQ
jgi:aminopeptidase YwaD